MANIFLTKHKKLNYRRDNARCVKQPFKSLNVIRCCANRCGIYNLALDSKLISLQPLLRYHTPSLYSLAII